MKSIKRCVKEPCDVCDYKEALLFMGMENLLSADDVVEDDDAPRTNDHTRGDER